MEIEFRRAENSAVSNSFPATAKSIAIYTNSLEFQIRELRPTIRPPLLIIQQNPSGKPRKIVVEIDPPNPLWLLSISPKLCSKISFSVTPPMVSPSCLQYLGSNMSWYKARDSQNQRPKIWLFRLDLWIAPLTWVGGRHPNRIHSYRTACSFYRDSPNEGSRPQIKKQMFQSAQEINSVPSKQMSREIRNKIEMMIHSRIMPEVANGSGSVVQEIPPVNRPSAF